MADTLSPIDRMIASSKIAGDLRPTRDTAASCVLSQLRDTLDIAEKVASFAESRLEPIVRERLNETDKICATAPARQFPPLFQEIHNLNREIAAHLARIQHVVDRADI
jgi:hypothetical protein